MPSLSIPVEGLTLNSPQFADNADQAKVTQALRLSLPEGMIEELIRSSRNGSKGIQLSFGKTPTIYYGRHSRALTSNSEPYRHEIYSSRSFDGTSDMELTGVVSHLLEIPKAKNVTGGADAAMLALKTKMAALDQEKKSKTSIYVKDGKGLPPAVSRRGPAPKTTNTSRFLNAPKNKVLLSNGTTRSMPTSPSLAARSPSLLPHAPTSTPLLATSPHQLQIRHVLIHLLAIGPVAEEDVVRKTGSTKDEAKATCLELLQKVGKPSKAGNGWILSDRFFKELDIWKFNYGTLGNRQKAVDNAVSAFDRLRVSKEDKLWDRLLPKEERGKGKVLSKLQFRNGPGGVTPNFKHTDDDMTAESAEDSDRAAPKVPVSLSKVTGGEGMARSVSQPPLTTAKKRVSEKEALAKRLLSKPKHNVHPRKPNSAPRKAETTKANSKIKSTEFVNDSDEDDVMTDAFGEARNTKQTPPKETKPAHSPTPSQAPVRVAKPAAKPTAKPPAKPPVKQATKPATISKPASKSSQSSEGEPLRKPVEAKSKAPVKKESHPNSSVSSGSHRKSDASLSSSLSGYTQVTKRDTYKHQKSTSPQKPSPLGSSPPTNASDMESDSYNGSSSSSSPLISQSRKLGMSLAAGVKRKVDLGDSNSQANKRRQYSELSSISPPNGGSESPLAAAIEIATEFKQRYMVYERLYRDVSQMSNPPAERLEKVWEMHQSLERSKLDIVRLV